ncbi:hypothetical protein CEXT_626701 [Caerostris extrusa]|uniref:Uncharacterized protein n=1 Tax=Caerostris extrusa TaxID=172846 RepID=A0AAV4RHB8_CAEEX|nr:hypothetical protein CEXT_626701 [Caerostris extrusa]
MLHEFLLVKKTLCKLVQVHVHHLNTQMSRRGFGTAEEMTVYNSDGFSDVIPMSSLRMPFLRKNAFRKGNLCGYFSLRGSGESSETPSLILRTFRNVYREWYLKRYFERSIEANSSYGYLCID